jgi:hypothetical protein
VQSLNQAELALPHYSPPRPTTRGTPCLAPPAHRSRTPSAVPRRGRRRLRVSDPARDRSRRGQRPIRGLGRGQLRHNEAVTDVRPAASADPARWLLRTDVGWWDLVRFGPPGFDAYVRISLAGGADGPDQDDEESSLRDALRILAGHTTTPDTGYAAIWEGWDDVAPMAPRIAIPNREMLLFTGPVAELRDAPALAWYGSAQGILQEPHLVWPEDEAWCLACEVDEEIEFTVGCSDEVSQALAKALPGAVRRAIYGESAPMYRD